MLLTIKKEIEEQIDVELPLYVKGGADTFYRVNENQYSKVTIYEGTKLTQYAIESLTGFDIPPYLFGYEKVPEATFNNVYQKALTHLNKELTPYENWQEKRYGDILSINGNALPANEDEEELMYRSAMEDNHIYQVENEQL